MTDSQALAQISRAEVALDATTDIGEIKGLYDLAEAYRTYAKSAEEQNLAATFKIHAAAKGGALLAANPNMNSGRPTKNNAASLAALFPALTSAAAQHLSSRWQRIARLAELGTLDAYLSSATDIDADITVAGLLRYADLGTLNSSESPEWYTPSRYIDAARKVMGSIDLDGASCEAANKVVGATQFFTAVDDALNKPWHGNVWLNPPYGKSAPKGNTLFIPKLVAEYKAGNVTAAITLTSAHGTETSWFKQLWDFTVCFTDHRVLYWNEDGIGAPTFGSAFTYMGPNPDLFTAVFSQFGTVVERRQVAA